MKTSMVGLAVVAFLLLIVPVSGVLAWRTTGGYPRALDTSNSDCKYPAMYNIITSQGDIEIVTWQQWETDHWDIFFRYGSGATWAPANAYRLTNNGVWGNNDNDCEHPDVSASIDQNEESWFTVYIAWQYKHPDYGNTWEIEVSRIIITQVDTNWPGIINTVEYASIHQSQIPNQNISVSLWDNCHSKYPAIDCGDNVYLAWEDYRHGVSSPRIYFDWSLQGLTWQYTDQMWSRNYNALDPCIAVDRDSDPTYDKICVLWEDYGDNPPNSQIYGRAAYLDAGSNWYYSSFQVQDGATLNNELNPDIEDFDGEFLYVWQDNRNGDWEIYYGKTAFNANPPISPQYWNTMRVTLDQNADENPAIDVCENDYDPQNVFNEIHICWDTDRTGVRDIYACRGVQSPGTTFDTLSSSGQGQSDNRVSFSNAIETYPDISCSSRDGYCVWQRDNNPWEIRYTIDP